MKAIVITIGDEILIGQIIDTNSAWIAKELNAVGVSVSKMMSVSDNEDVIIETLNTVIKEADLIILTGGVGPTKDDKTKSALSKYFNSKLFRHSPTLKKIEKLMANRGIPLTEINKQQADLPENCTILSNPEGSVPGMLFKKEKNIIVSVPGVPFEMKHIIGNELIPYLIKHYELPNIIHKTFLTVGVAESILAGRLEEFEGSLPENFTLAYLPSPGKVRLRLSARGTKEDNVSEEFIKIENKLIKLLGKDMFGYDEDTLELVIGNLLKDNNLTVCTAESCTGGDIANTITNVPGASKYYKGSIISYSNSVKQEILKVSASDLEEFGAVSKQVVVQMAENARKLLKTDFGVATSGVAGPSGGSNNKPIGTVWIAVASPEEVFAEKFYLGEHRGRTITRTTLMALNMLRLEINKIVEKTVKKV